MVLRSPTQIHQKHIIAVTNMDAPFPVLTWVILNDPPMIFVFWGLLNMEAIEVRISGTLLISVKQYAHIPAAEELVGGIAAVCGAVGRFERLAFERFFDFMLVFRGQRKSRKGGCDGSRTEDGLSILSSIHL